MKVLLIGASGMVGSRILAELRSRGHEVVAATRKPFAVPEGVVSVQLDASDAGAIVAAAEGVDAIVSASSPRSTGDAMTEMGALGAALIAAGEQTGKRVLLVGGAGSLLLPDGRNVVEVVPEIYRKEALSMLAVLGKLKASTADWTFFAPAGEIAPGARTGVFRLGKEHLLSDAEGQSRISAEDFAAALVGELEVPRNRGGVMTAAY